MGPLAPSESNKAQLSAIWMPFWPIKRPSASRPWKDWDQKTVNAESLCNVFETWAEDNWIEGCVDVRMTASSG